MKRRNKQLGKLSPRYSFILNKYRNARFSKCPKCEGTMNMRKFALFIHIYNWGPLTLGKTCRYCFRCELIIAHQNAIESELQNFFKKYCPGKKDYLVMGTIQIKAWKKGLQQKITNMEQMLEYATDFKEVLNLEARHDAWGNN